MAGVTPDGRRATTAADRLRDAIALVLLVGGVATFLWARRQLSALASGALARPRTGSMIALAEHYDRLSSWGLALAAAGIVAAVASALVSHRRRRAAGVPPSGSP